MIQVSEAPREQPATLAAAQAVAYFLPIQISVFHSHPIFLSDCASDNLLNDARLPELRPAFGTCVLFRTLGMLSRKEQFLGQALVPTVLGKGLQSHRPTWWRRLALNGASDGAIRPLGVRAASQFLHAAQVHRGL